MSIQQDKNQNNNDSFFKRPPGILLDEAQWLYLKEHYHMTLRELQVAILICRGFNNNEIADALKIKHGTVKTHIRNLFRRVRVKSKILMLLRFVDDIKQADFQTPKNKTPLPILEMPAKISKLSEISHEIYPSEQ